MDLASLVTYALLGAGFLLLCTLFYRWQWCSVSGLMERALEAADEGKASWAIFWRLRRISPAN